MIHFGDIDAYTARIEAEARSTLLVDVLAVVDGLSDEAQHDGRLDSRDKEAILYLLKGLRTRLAALNQKDKPKPEGETVNEYAEGNIVVTEDPDEDKALKR